MPEAQFLPAAEDITDVFHVNTDSEGKSETSQKARLEDIIADLNDTDSDATLSIYRQSPMGGKSAMTFLATFPPDKYTMDELQLWLRDNHGSGDYRVQIRSGGRIRANKLLSIEAPQTETTERKPTSEAGEVLNVVMAAMEKQNQMIMATIQNQSQPSEEDMLRKMVIYKELFGGNSSGNGLAQINETLAMLQTLGIEIGQPKEEDGFANIVDKMTPLATALMNSPENQQQPNQQQAAGSYQPNTKQREQAMFKQAMLKAGINSLLKAAAKNANTAFYSDWVLDQLDPKVVAEFITAPDAMQKLEKLAPLVSQHRAWFQDLAEHIKGQLGMPSIYEAEYSENEQDQTIVGDGHLQEDIDDDINPENLSTSDESESDELPAT